MQVPDELIALIRKEKSFLLVTHVSPDGDALGSSLALSFALRTLGKETVLYDRDPVPAFYRFLPGCEQFTRSFPERFPAHAPVIFLDCNEPERAGLNNREIPLPVVIDHHETERPFGRIRWVDPLSPATGLMIYSLITALGIPLSADMATNLYTALAIDTGTFRFRNTTAEALRTAAALVDAGADPSFIAEGLYESWSPGRFRLLLDVLGTLEIVDDVAMTIATKEMFERTGTAAEDTEHFPSFPRMMKDIALSVFFRETDEGWKVSLRSRGRYNAAQLAEQFKGGGHRNAAGFRTKADLKSAKEKLLAALTEKKGSSCS